LLVVNATKDSFQFSVAEAAKSVARARPIFQLYGAEEKLRHATFESGHAYNAPMREAMYGWMTRWLKEEGDGKPIPEPSHQTESPKDLACFPDGVRPKRFLFPPSFAAREARALVAKHQRDKPSHTEEWEAAAVFVRSQLRKAVFGDFPKPPQPVAKMGKPVQTGTVKTTPIVLTPEAGLPLPALLRSGAAKGKAPACVLLHLDGKGEALKHPLAAALVDKGWSVLAPDLRGTGETKPEKDAIGGAPDHNSAEHALWLGRPLLGQWVFDVQCLLDWLAIQPNLDKRRFAVVGVGQAGLVALCAAGLLEDRVASAASIGGLSTLITDTAYAPGTHIGLLAPSLLRWADIPQLAALAAPRRLIVGDGVTPQGRKLAHEALNEAFAFTRGIYHLYKMEGKLTVETGVAEKELAEGL
jgi:dienelactone hydrolase